MDGTRSEEPGTHSQETARKRNSDHLDNEEVGGMNNEGDSNLNLAVDVNVSVNDPAAVEILGDLRRVPAFKVFWFFFIIFSIFILCMIL